MGAAAYNRGSKAISEQIDRERPSAELTILRDLTEFSAAHDGIVPFADTVVRFGPAEGEVSLMNRQRGGWGQRGVSYDSLWALAKHWRLVFLDFGQDEHGRYVRVAPAARTCGFLGAITVPR